MATIGSRPQARARSSSAWRPRFEPSAKAMPRMFSPCSDASRSDPPSIGRPAMVMPRRAGSSSRKPTTSWTPTARMMSSSTFAEPSGRAPKMTVRSGPARSGTHRLGRLAALHEHLHVLHVPAARIVVVDAPVFERGLHFVDRRLDGVGGVVTERLRDLVGVDPVRARVGEAGKGELAGDPRLHHLRDVDDRVV